MYLGNKGSVSGTYRWPFGPIPMGARSPTHISPTRAQHGPEYYWARAGTGTIAGPCLGLNPDPWTRPSTARKSQPNRPDGRHGGPGTAHGPLARPGRQKSRWRRWRAAGPAQRSGYVKGRRPPFARPRPPFARPARPRPLSASPLPSRPRLTLTLDRASPLPSRLHLDLTVFSNSGRRLAAVGRPLYPLLFVFLPTFASSPVDSILNSNPSPNPVIPL